MLLVALDAAGRSLVTAAFTCKFTLFHFFSTPNEAASYVFFSLYERNSGDSCLENDSMNKRDSLLSLGIRALSFRLSSGLELWHGMANQAI